MGDAGEQVRSLRHADENAERRAECEREAGIDDLQRIGAEQNRGRQRRDVDGQRPVIAQLRREVNRGHQRGAAHRRSAFHHEA